MKHLSLKKIVDIGVNIKMTWPIDWNREYESHKSPLWETEKTEDILVGVLNDYEPGFVLDVGCGTGTDLLYMARKKLRVIGIDISFAGLIRAKSRIQSEKLDIPLVQSNVLAIPFPYSTFDFINDRGCFHHIHPNLRNSYASEARRVLKPRGLLLLRCFSEKYFQGGGKGYLLTKNDIIDTFSPHFHINDIKEYVSIVDEIPVDMSWCLMREKSSGRTRKRIQSPSLKS